MDEKVSQAKVVERLHEFVKPKSNIELLLNALLKFYLGEEDNEWCLTHSTHHMSKNCPHLLYKLNVKRPNTVLDCDLTLLYTGKVDPELNNYLSFAPTIMFQPAVDDASCDELDFSCWYCIDATIYRFSNSPKYPYIDIGKCNEIKVDAGKLVLINQSDSDYDRESMYSYHIKINESNDVYVEVVQKDNIIGTIEFFEFLDAFSNREYNKLVLCKFSTFKESAKTNSKSL